MLYLRGSKIFDRIYIILILLFATTFYQPVAMRVGNFLFAKKNQNLQVLDTNVTMDILYKGRQSIYLKKPNLSRAVKYRYSEIKLLKI
jgi:hypothetical protein